jgi:hypothetical protein
MPNNGGYAVAAYTLAALIYAGYALSILLRRRAHGRREDER